MLSTRARSIRNIRRIMPDGLKADLIAMRREEVLEVDVAARSDLERIRNEVAPAFGDRLLSTEVYIDTPYQGAIAFLGKDKIARVGFSEYAALALNDAQKRAIMAHELCHLDRRSRYANSARNAVRKASLIAIWGGAADAARDYVGGAVRSFSKAFSAHSHGIVLHSIWASTADSGKVVAAALVATIATVAVRSVSQHSARKAELKADKAAVMVAGLNAAVTALIEIVPNRKQILNDLLGDAEEQGKSRLFGIGYKEGIGERLRRPFRKVMSEIAWLQYTTHPTTISRIERSIKFAKRHGLAEGHQ